MRVHVFSIFFTCFVYEAVALAINSNIAPTAESTTNSTKVIEYREMWTLWFFLFSTESIRINYFQLHVAIYYESLCSDSMDFLTNQFAPAYDSLKDYMDVLFVPFGKAEVKDLNGHLDRCQCATSFLRNFCVIFLCILWQLLLYFSLSLCMISYWNVLSMIDEEWKWWTEFLLPTWPSRMYG